MSTPRPLKRGGVARGFLVAPQSAVEAEARAGRPSPSPPGGDERARSDENFWPNWACPRRDRRRRWRRFLKSALPQRQVARCARCGGQPGAGEPRRAGGLRRRLYRCGDLRAEPSDLLRGGRGAAGAYRPPCREGRRAAALAVAPMRRPGPADLAPDAAPGQPTPPTLAAPEEDGRPRHYRPPRAGCSFRDFLMTDTLTPPPPPPPTPDRRGGRLRADLYNFLGLILSRPPDGTLLEQPPRSAGTAASWAKAVTTLPHGAPDQASAARANTRLFIGLGRASCCLCQLLPDRLLNESRWPAAPGRDNAGLARADGVRTRTTSPA